MTKLRTWLAGIFALQVCLALVIYFANSGEAEFDNQKSLVNVELAKVDKLVFSDGLKTATLEKQDDQWVLPGFYQLPINDRKLSELLTKLFEVKSGWPVATSASSHTRFEVESDVFQRKVEIFVGEDLAQTILLGSSPGYRSVHARVAGEDDVYNVKLANHEFATNNVDWLDKTLLELTDITTIKGNDFELSKSSEAWALVQSNVVDAAAPVLDTAKADTLESLFKSIRVTDVVSEALPQENTSIVVTASNGSFTYQFFAKGDRYFAKRNDREQVFEIRDVDYNKIENATLENLAAKDDAEASSEEAADLSLN